MSAKADVDATPFYINRNLDSYGVIGRSLAMLGRIAETEAVFRKAIVEARTKLHVCTLRNILHAL